MARLKELFTKEIKPNLKKEFGYKQNKLKFESDEQFKKTNETFSNEAQELQNGYDLYIKNSNALEKEIALVERMSEEELVNNQGFVKDLNERIIQQNVARENLENATEGFKQKEIDLLKLKDQKFDMVARYLDDLPADQLDLLKMNFFEEKSHGEISEITKIPLGTVKSRIRLALEKIRGKLEQDGTMADLNASNESNMIN